MERISMRYPRVASYQQKRYFNTSWASYQWKASVLSATGIISMVNVCFFDSICQVLYSLTEFWRYVVDDEDHLPLFPNYSICCCSIQEWHHMNARHLATFSRWKRLRAGRAVPSNLVFGAFFAQYVFRIEQRHMEKLVAVVPVAIFFIA